MLKALVAVGVLCAACAGVAPGPTPHVATDAASGTAPAHPPAATVVPSAAGPAGSLPQPASATPFLTAPSPPARTRRPERTILVPTEPPEGRLEEGRTWVRVWQEGGVARAQVIHEVRNTGDGWLYVEPISSGYAIYSATGYVSQTGNFSAAFPTLVPPRQTGYLTAEALPAPPEHLVRAEAVTVGYSTDEVAGDEVTFSNVRVRAVPSGGLQATGVAHNTGPSIALDTTIGVFYLDSTRAVLGFSAADIGNVPLGATTPFTTHNATPRLRPSDVANVVTIASVFD